LSEKTALYAEAGIVEFWIVDMGAMCIHVFRNPRQGKYDLPIIANVGNHLSPQEPCHTPLDLRELFAAE
jgi:Uma2 family endonuclease